MWTWLKNLGLALIGKESVSVNVAWETFSTRLENRLDHTERRCDSLEDKLDTTKSALLTTRADVEDCKKDREMIRSMEVECRKETESLRGEIDVLRKSMKACLSCECPLNGEHNGE